MKVPRVTDLSVEEIKRVIDGLSKSRWQICALINDLGIIALNDGEDSGQAETILVSQFDKEIRIKWVAIRYLCILEKIDKASPDTIKAIKSFKLNPMNKDIFPTDEEINRGVARMI